MFTRSLILAAVLAVCPITALAEAPPLPQTLTIEDIDLISDGMVWLEVTLPRVEALAERLESVSNEGMSAAELASVRQSYMEYVVLAMRLVFLDPPTDEQLAQTQVQRNRLDAAQARIYKQFRRLADSERVDSQTRAFAQTISIDVPRAARDPAERVRNQTQILRSQLELYALQHKEPANLRKHGWKQLTSRTDFNGNIVPNGKYGPYLVEPPVNPLNRSVRVVFVEGAPGRNFTYTEKPAGWVMDLKSGRFWPLDGSGKIIDETGLADARE